LEIRAVLFAEGMMYLSVVPVVPSPDLIRVMDPLQMLREASFLTLEAPAHPESFRSAKVS